MRIFLLGLLFLFSCRENSEYIQKIPIGFPEIDYPKNNVPTKASVKLGEKLFFDPLLSLDSTTSCSSCHKPQFAFADNVSVSEGVNGPIGIRNSYSLMNVAYQKSMFMDGGIPTLELQAIAPITMEAEQNISMGAAAERLSQNEEYQELSNRAYGTDLSASVITKALSSYERTLISSGSRFDRFYFSNDESVLSAKEKEGWEIFNMQGNCIKCHSSFLFTDHTFQNIGLYENYNDFGRFRITDDSSDIGKFKVPSLRNVALTAPYMHDGSFPDLESVISHFNSGGYEHKNKSEFITPLGLDEDQSKALIAFLNCLTDTTLIN